MLHPRFLAGALGLALASVLPAQSLCSASIELSGAQNYVSVPTHRNLQNPTAASYEAWFYPLAYHSRIVSKGDGWSALSNRTFDLSLDRQGRVVAEFFVNKGSGGRTYYPMFSSATVPLRQWTHAVATFDSQTRMAKLYINGKLDQSRQTGVGDTLYQSTIPLYIGATPPHQVNFQGRINQVRVWDHALSAALVTAFAGIETPGLPGNTGQWSFDGHTFDLTGGHDGKVIGPTKWVAGCASAAIYHQGTAGPFGIPSLDVSKAPVLGTTIDLGTTNSSRNPAVGVLVFGLRPVRIPLFGGTLLADPQFVFTVPVGPTRGSWPFRVPNDPQLAGVPVFVQLGVVYPGKAQPGLSPGLVLMPGS